MTQEEKKNLARSLHEIIVEVLGGPRGDPDESHVEAARICYDIIDEFSLESEITEISGEDYEEDKNRFFEENYEESEDGMLSNGYEESPKDGSRFP